MNTTLKAFFDLTRAHFFFAWPLLFCSGLMLAFENYGNFSWFLTLKVALIGLIGFEAGFILNDYVDREYDKKDVETGGLTSYWRPFKERPIASGLIAPEKALILFFSLVILAIFLTISLAWPHSLFVIAIGVYSYSIEYFYQVKKRDQTLPLAQLLGRTDFAFFPIAGYLALGYPDLTAVMYFIFFYPFAEAHLGVNDLADIENDRARGMKTIPILYGIRGTTRWILGFSLLHIFAALLFMTRLGVVTRIGFIIGIGLIGIANYRILKEKSEHVALEVLPLFHVTMVVYTVAIILGYVL